MDEYLSIRFERLGEDLVCQLFKIFEMEKCSDEVKLRWAEEMKEFGNHYFRKGDFDYALLVYETICDGIIPRDSSVKNSSEKYLKVVSTCLLNLAACFLKECFNDVISFCNQVVIIDPQNAKGYYRRAQAYAKRGDLQLALNDFERALVFEPHDKTILKDMDLVKKKLGIQYQDGNSADVSPIRDAIHPVLAEEKKEKKRKQICGTRVDSIYEANVCENGVKQAVSMKPRRRKQKVCSTMSDENENPKDDTCMDERMEECPNENREVPSNGKHQQKFQFTKSNQPNNSLLISTKGMEKLRQGEVITFYNPYSISVLTVSISKKSSNPVTKSSHECDPIQPMVSDETIHPEWKQTTQLKNQF